MKARGGAVGKAVVESESDTRLGDLAKSLSFHIKRTDALVFQHFNRRFPRSRLVRGEVAILTLVKANPGLNQEALGKATGLDKSTISAAIAKLKRRALIEQRATEDKRVRKLHLTAAGRGFLRRITPLIDEHESEIAAALSERESKELVRLLGRIFATVASLDRPQ